MKQNPIGKYESDLLKQRREQNQLDEIAKSMHHYFYEKILKTDPEGCYKFLILLSDGRIFGFKNKRDSDEDNWCKEGAPHILGSCNAEYYTISTSVGPISQSFGIKQNYKITFQGVEFESVRVGTMKYDKWITMKEDKRFDQELLGEPVRTFEIE